MVAGGIDARRLVFVDEMGANVSLSPLYAWSRRGQRAHAKAPRNWGKNVTLLASITHEGVGPCLAVEGATTREVFEAYLEGVMVPSLSPGRVVVMDNLSAHKGGRVREIVEGAGASSCTCRPTRPTSTPLSRPSARSRGSSAGPKRAPAGRWWRLWARRSTPCPPETRAGSSRTAATVQWVNRYDGRSSHCGTRRWILRSWNARLWTEHPLRGARVASEATRAAWE